MFSPERKWARRGVGILFAVGLGATACSGQSSQKSESTTVPAVKNEDLGQSDSGFQDFTVKHIYTASGKRFTTYGNIADPTHRGSLTSNVGYCDGNDLVEMPIQYYAEGGNSVITRTKFDGCSDGKLTPSDFPGEQK